MGLGDIGKAALAAVNPTALLATLASDAAGALWQNTQNKKAATTAWNRQLATMQYQDWYNTPAEQMKRYEAAGLNPNLIYGQQNYSAGTSSVPMASSVSAPDVGRNMNRLWDNERAERQLDLLDSYRERKLGQDIQLGQAQIEEIQARRQLMGMQFMKGAVDLQSALHNLRLAVDRGVPLNATDFERMLGSLYGFTSNLGSDLAGFVLKTKQNYGKDEIDIPLE